MSFLGDIRSGRAWKRLEERWPTNPGVAPPHGAQALEQAAHADILGKTKLLMEQPGFDAIVGLDFATWTLLRTRDAAIEALSAGDLRDAAASLVSADDASTIASVAERLAPGRDDDAVPTTPGLLPRQVVEESAQRWLDETRRNPPVPASELVARARSDPAFAERTLRDNAAQAIGQVRGAARVYRHRDDLLANRAAAAARAAGMATFAGVAAGIARQVGWFAEAIWETSDEAPPPALSVGYEAEFRAQIDWLREHLGRR
jgi:hypothetical protein